MPGLAKSGKRRRRKSRLCVDDGEHSSEQCEADTKDLTASLTDDSSGAPPDDDQGIKESVPPPRERSLIDEAEARTLRADLRTDQANTRTDEANIPATFGIFTQLF